MMKKLSEFVTLAPSHDIEGDCGTTIALRFDTAEKAKAVSEAVGTICPINTGKHVYSNWKPILEKRGAFHPLMDPFKMEANRDIIPDYSPDMCPKSLDLLSRTVYIGVNPDETVADMDAKIEKVKNAI